MEAELARQARILDAGQLAVLGKRMLAYLDQDGRPPKDHPETRRWMRLRDRDGGCELSGWLDREAAEIVRSALSPLAAPRPATDVEVDLRTTVQRDADALVELAQRGLGSGELPTEGGQRPQVVVTVSLPVLHGRIGSASLTPGGPINAATTDSFTIPSGASIWPTASPNSTRHPGWAEPRAATPSTLYRT